MAVGQQKWRLFSLIFVLALVDLPCMAEAETVRASFMNFTYERPMAADPVTAVGALIYRVLPQYLHQFQLELIDPVGESDVMQLASNSSFIVLRGSSAVALASAFNWYLNEYCHVTYDWNNYDLSAIKSPLQLPPAAGTPLRRRFVKWSYYMNVCTMGYSLAFSSWDYWTKHIDWMAMNGINMPLAFVGQEAILVRVFTEDFGLTFEELQQFISGPAFLPWFRMGNIQGWGGPVTLNWIEARFSLQLQILTRMRDLGMKPVLSAFAGHVPEGFVHRYPDANVTRSPNWGNFPAPYGQVYLLEATDVRFGDIGTRYIAMQTQLFGTDHLYNCDTFNEMDPRSNASSYLAASSRAVFNAMLNADPAAVWLMQSWLFRDSSAFWGPAQIQAYLGAVPDDRLWLLDLSANDDPIWSKTNSFYGKPFIWCNLLDFGGQQGIDGNLPAIHDDIMRAVASKSTIIGVGITMEGIWQNYPAFEYTLRFGWLNNTPQDYIIDYADRRYGPDAPKSINALWRDLGNTFYAGGGSFGSLITRRPVLNPSTGIVSSTALNLTPPLPAWLGRLTQQDTASDLAYAYHTSLFPSIQPVEETLPSHVGDQCSYGKVRNTTLVAYASGFDPSQPPYDLSSLTAAVRWCSGVGAGCGGITLVQGRYEARASWTGVPHNSDVSFTKLCSSPLVNMWRGLLSVRSTLRTVPAYSFDLVDVSRQVLSGNFSNLFSQYQSLFSIKPPQVDKAKALAQQMQDLIHDFDTLLSSDVNFLLGPWIRDARAWGETDSERAWLEFNARNQLTLWGPRGEVNDYAAKSWGGLVRGYYTPRWNLFFSDSLTALEAGKPFNQTAYTERVLQTIEQPWQTATETYPVTPEHDSTEVSYALFQKYIGSL